MSLANIKKQYPIYCQSGPERCSPFEFLGFAALGEALRCPRCGRWTAAGRRKPIKTTQTTGGKSNATQRRVLQY